MDFIITVKNSPNYVKEKLLQLPNTPLVQMAKVFVYKTPFGTEIQIDICSSELVKFLVTPQLIPFSILLISEIVTISSRYCADDIYHTSGRATPLH